MGFLNAIEHSFNQAGAHTCAHASMEYSEREKNTEVIRLIQFYHSQCYEFSAISWLFFLFVSLFFSWFHSLHWIEEAKKWAEIQIYTQYSNMRVMCVAPYFLFLSFYQLNRRKKPIKLNRLQIVRSLCALLFAYVFELFEMFAKCRSFIYAYTVLILFNSHFVCVV